MSYALTTDLLISAGTLFLVGMAICLRVLSVPASMALAGIKVTLPFVYFVFFYNGSWTFLDDIGYFEQGQELLAQGYDPFLFFFDGEALQRLMALSGGFHILYGWYNLLSQWMFGPHYYSPVFLNVGLTLGAAYYLYQLAIISEFSTRYARGLFVFFSLHWELLAWSSLVNLKDTLILFMTIVFVYAAVRVIQTKRKKYVIALVGLFFLFFWIRFYVPLMLLLAALVSLPWTAGRRGKKWVAALLVAGFGATYGMFIGWENVLGQLARLDITAGALEGMIRMALTPQPWSIDPEYTFLLLPAMLHWIFFIPAIVGGVMLWRERPQLRFLLVYLAIALLVYGAFDELQGPRHRVQLIFIYAWTQFHFVWYLLRGRMTKHLALGSPV